jgi:hypothetical protein
MECFVGSFVNHDVVQLPEQQHNKKYHGVPSSLPGKDILVGAHTAEVLRQVENSEVVRGGWVGGDAWFGSVITSVEVMKRFGVHSTFIIKNNHVMYPMQALIAVMKARFSGRPAGHWVTFRAEIAGVKLFALAYAWSQRGVSYFLSTCGRTDPHPIKYKSNYEDDYGVVTFKELSRPHIAHFLYDYLPLIDEHNKQRQSILNLERVWLTNDCWMRLVTTMCGMSVVDFHRYIKNRNWHYNNGDDTVATVQEDDTLPEDEDIKIKQFSDKICKWLDKIVLRNRASPRKTRFTGNASEMLERISDEQGHITKPPTQKQQMKHGRNVGNAIVVNCFVCRMYLDEKERTTYINTQWRCKVCHMPLCKKKEGRRFTTKPVMH